MAKIALSTGFSGDEQEKTCYACGLKQKYGMQFCVELPQTMAYLSDVGLAVEKAFDGGFSGADAALLELGLAAASAL